MLNTLRNRILIVLAATVLGSALIITVFSQLETEKHILDRQNEHARDLLETVYLNVENEFKSYRFYQQALLFERKSNLRSIGDIALNEILRFHEKASAGELSLGEAQRQAIEVIERMRYAGGVGYVWIQNSEMPTPKVIMHPTLPHLNGKAGDDPAFYQATQGQGNLLDKIVEAARPEGGGFLTYSWAKPAPEGLTVQRAKVSHVRHFKPWDWIIGTGLYVDDIERDSRKRLDAIVDELRHTFLQVERSGHGHLFLFTGEREMLIHLEEIPGDAGKDSGHHPMGHNLVELMAVAQSVDDDGRLVWNQPPVHERVGGSPLTSNVVHFAPLDWYIVASMHEDRIMQPVMDLRWKVVLISGFFITLAVIVSSLLARSLSRPLGRLTAAAREIEAKGLVDTDIPVTGTLETRELAYCLDAMLKSIRQSASDKEQLLHELKNSEKDLRITLDSIGDAVIATDRSGRIARMNPVSEQLTGWRFEDAVGEPVEKVLHMVHADSREPLSNPVNKVLASGRISGLSNHTTLVAKSGKEFQIADSAAPIRDDHGDVTGVVLVFRDVSEEYRIRQAMREAEELQRNVLDNTSSLIYIKDPQGRYLYINRVYEELFDVTDAEFKGKTDMDVVPKPVAEAFRANDLKALDADGPLEFEETFSREDGEHFYLSVKFPLKKSSGQVFAVCGISTDFTERKREQNELNRLRRYLSSIIDSMPSTLIGVDMENRVTLWNRTAEQTTGVDAEQARGKHLLDVFPKMASVAGAIDFSIRTGVTRHEQERSLAADDRALIEDITIYPLATGGVEGAVIRMDDVTERVHMKETMIQSEKMLSLGGLAAGMAHEINNPLGGIMQTAAVLADRLTGELKANDRAAEVVGARMETIRAYMDKRSVPRMLDTIKDSCGRAALIVDNMLGFARKGDSSLSSCNLAELLDQTVQLAGTDYDLKKRYDFRKIEIVREYADDVPVIPCESQKLQQVLLNILKNGAQAMHGAGTPGRGATEKPRFVLRLIHEKAAKTVRIEIVDNGPGMDEATRKRVFEPFFTTKPVGLGSGLGLSVSYFIVAENHRGTMTVESTPGGGATFIIRLPIERNRP